MKKRVIGVGLALASASLLVGCSSMGVRVTAGGGSPVKVGVSQEKGGTSEPTPTEDPIPEGYWKADIVNDACPFDISIVVPDEYKMNGESTSGFTLFYDPHAGSSNSLSVMCSKTTYDTPAKARDSKTDYLASSPGSRVLLQNKYQIESSAAAVYQVKMAKDDIFTGGDTQRVGSVYAAFAKGELWSVEIEATSPWGDEDRAKKNQTAIDNVTVDGHKLKTLDWQDM